MTISAQAFDVEGGLLNYIWTDSMGNDLGCDSDSSTCAVELSQDNVPSFEYNLQVIDDFGASDAETGYVTLMNSNLIHKFWIRQWHFRIISY